MKKLHFAPVLCIVKALHTYAQTSALHDDLFQEPRFAISRGSDFTFQPATGSTCRWAVAQYPDASTTFFDLIERQSCPYPENNGTSTLRLRFGNDIQPGNVTLTVQCKEPSVYNFLISDDEPNGEDKTSVESVCSSDTAASGHSNPILSPTGSDDTRNPAPSILDSSPAAVSSQQPSSGLSSFATVTTAAGDASQGFTDPLQNPAMSEPATIGEGADLPTILTDPSGAAESTAESSTKPQHESNAPQKSAATIPGETEGGTIAGSISPSGETTSEGLVAPPQPTDTDGAAQEAPAEGSLRSSNTGNGGESPITSMTTLDPASNQYGSATTTSCVCTC